jgi:hypothetical protein
MMRNETWKDISCQLHDDLSTNQENKFQEHFQNELCTCVAWRYRQGSVPLVV